MHQSMDRMLVSRNCVTIELSFLVGINQMGLFSFLQPISDDDTNKRRKYARFLPRIVDRPVEYRLELIDDNDRILSTLIVYRHFMHQNVERREIEIGRIRGTLFTRKGIVINSVSN